MTTTRSVRRRTAAAAVAGALLFGTAACGDDDANVSDDGNGSATTQTMGGDSDSTDGDDANGHDTDGEAHGSAGDVTTDHPASELRATLTAGLQEHVYLAGIAVYAAVNTPDAFDAAAGALDENSVALSEAIGDIYGEEAEEAFLGLWREHIDMFVDYTTARASDDQEGMDAAVDDLTQYSQDFGAFLEGANPNLPADVVATELETHASSLIEAIDAVVTGDADGFSKLRAAAGHMPMTANALAGGIAAQFPEDFG